jgi:hypothetical protein
VNARLQKHLTRRRTWNIHTHKYSHLNINILYYTKNGTQRVEYETQTSHPERRRHGKRHKHPPGEEEDTGNAYRHPPEETGRDAGRRLQKHPARRRDAGNACRSTSRLEEDMESLPETSQF